MEEPTDTETENTQHKLKALLTRPRTLLRYTPSEGPLNTGQLELGAAELFAALKGSDPPTARKKILKFAVGLSLAGLLLYPVINWPSMGLAVIGKDPEPFSTILDPLFGVFVIVVLVSLYSYWTLFAEVTHQNVGTIWISSTGKEDVAIGFSKTFGKLVQRTYDLLQAGGLFREQETSLAAQLGYPDGLPDGSEVHLLEMKTKPYQPGDQLLTEQTLAQLDEDSLYLDTERLISTVHKSNSPAIIQILIAPQLDATRLLDQFKKLIEIFHGTSIYAILAGFPTIFRSENQSNTNSQYRSQSDEFTNESLPPEQQDRIDCMRAQRRTPTFGITVRAFVICPARTSPDDNPLLNKIINQLNTKQSWKNISSTRKRITSGENHSGRDAETTTLDLLDRFDSVDFENRSVATNTFLRTPPAYLTVSGADVWRYALISTQTTNHISSKVGGIKRDQTIPASPSNEEYDRLQADVDVNPAVDTISDTESDNSEDSSEDIPHQSNDRSDDHTPGSVDSV